MMMAMCWGTAPTPPPAGSGALRSIAVIRAARPFLSDRKSDLCDFFFLDRQELIDFGDGLIGRFLNGIGIATLIVFGDVAVLFELLQQIQPVAPYMSHSYARLLGIFV